MLLYAANQFGRVPSLSKLHRSLQKSRLIIMCTVPLNRRGAFIDFQSLEHNLGNFYTRGPVSRSSVKLRTICVDEIYCQPGVQHHR